MRKRASFFYWMIAMQWRAGSARPDEIGTPKSDWGRLSLTKYMGGMLVTIFVGE
jgi:hypothetical protein